MEKNKIFQQIPLIMAEIDPVAKSRSNQAQGYKFRGIDDVYAAVQATLAKHKVFPVPTVLESTREERPTKSGGVMTFAIIKMKYTFYAEDGSSFESVVVGEGSDTGDKASNKAMSVAQKYCLIQVLCIPTEEPKDPEHDSPEKLPSPNPKEVSETEKLANKSGWVINDKQIKRMFAIASSKGVSNLEVKALAEKHGHKGSSKDMLSNCYNAVCAELEAMPNKA